MEYSLSNGVMYVVLRKRQTNTNKAYPQPLKSHFQPNNNKYLIEYLNCTKDVKN